MRQRKRTNNMDDKRHKTTVPSKRVNSMKDKRHNITLPKLSQNRVTMKLRKATNDTEDKRHSILQVTINQKQVNSVLRDSLEKSWLPLGWVRCWNVDDKVDTNMSLMLDQGGSITLTKDRKTMSTSLWFNLIRIILEPVYQMSRKVRSEIIRMVKGCTGQTRLLESKVVRQISTLQQ